MGPPPAVSDVRRAIRGALAGLSPGSLVFAACSGGADSLTMAAALAFVAPRMELRAGGLVVDHGLQDGSAEQTRQVAGTLRGLGLDPVVELQVQVGTGGGPEAAARDARYAALDAAAEDHGAAAVLIGHTLDDQAETVLLGLARGSGARSLCGMPESTGRYVRPFLGLTRERVREAGTAMGLTPWDDPHNSDPAFTRSRVRHGALPALEAALGPGIPEALARSARMLRDDADALDAWAERSGRAAQSAGGGLDVKSLADLPRAVRTRILRRTAIAAGSPPGTLAAVHITAMDELVTAWRGQRHVDLPGGLRALRRNGALHVVPAGARDGAAWAKAPV
ncbi:MAG: tRNA lysidine(34) synthetase TilS [Streptosporangiales bacterium]|nr:tRNA lysidine(34) synthetase TilS [Streptosporangiales bacterium]